MIERIIDWCAGNRFLVVTGAVVLAVWGAWAMLRTPLDDVLRREEQLEALARLRDADEAVPLRLALAKSINTIPVRLAQAIGRDKIVETAHALGINTELKITRPLPTWRSNWRSPAALISAGASITWVGVAS